MLKCPYDPNHELSKDMFIEQSNFCFMLASMTSQSQTLSQQVQQSVGQNNHLGDGSIDDTKVSANNDSSMNDAMLQMIQASSLSDSKNHSLDPCSIHGPTSKLPECPPLFGGMCS